LNTVHKILFCCLLLFVSFSCTDSGERKEVTRGVYFWKTNFNLDKNEIEWVKQNNIRKIYLRFFDVDWNSQTNTAVPVGDVTISTKHFNEAEIIPVVFITNRTFKNIRDSELPGLAGKILNKILGKISFFDSISVREIQLDCDWTKTTRDKYFTFLELLQKLSSQKQIEISATIRLHQVKFARETGVPPVKSGALMFYNMSDVSRIRTINSIFDKNIAQKYLVNFNNYPLHLDIILPAFSWVCLFRQSKLVSLINDLKESEFERNADFSRINDNFFLVEHTCCMKGESFLKGDYLRIEHIDHSITLKAAEMLSQHLQNKMITVSLYSLNNELVKNYENENVEEIFSAFR